MSLHYLSQRTSLIILIASVYLGGQTTLISMQEVPHDTPSVTQRTEAWNSRRPLRHPRTPSPIAARARLGLDPGGAPAAANLLGLGAPAAAAADGNRSYAGIVAGIGLFFLGAAAAGTQWVNSIRHRRIMQEPTPAPAPALSESQEVDFLKRKPLTPLQSRPQKTWLDSIKYPAIAFIISVAVGVKAWMMEEQPIAEDTDYNSKKALEVLGVGIAVISILYLIYILIVNAL